MKILIVSTKLPYPPRDGGSIATMNLARGLTASGVEVTLLTLNTKKHFFPPEDVPAWILQTIRLIAVPVDTGLRPLSALNNLLFSRNPYIAERFYSSEFEQTLKDLLEQTQPDMVQLEGPYAGIYLPVIRSSGTVKVALRAHNVEHEIWSRKAINTRNMLHRAYLRNLAQRIKRMEKDVLEASDMLVAISERDRKKLGLLAPSVPSVTAPAGIQIDNYPLEKPMMTDSLCFIGSLDWLPNQEGLLWFRNNVLPALLKKQPGLTFHVAGRNAPDDLLKKLSHPSIIYHGEVEDAAAFMNRYGVMAVPLLSGSGIRIKIIEAMALGRCVVTTPVGAEGIEAKHGSEIFIASTPGQFAEHLLSLLGDPAKFEEISVKARKFVQNNFDTFAIAKKLHAFYTEHI